jgi:ABC-type dipeptide/oligopeptide/nickel transport system ATPase component
MQEQRVQKGTPLLEVDNLQTHFFTEQGTVKSVDGVSFTVNAGETLAVVGESGSGKSVTSLSIMGLIPADAGRVVGGSIRFKRRDGEIVDLTRLPQRSLRQLRGNEIAMVFQEPMTSLNPVFTLGDQIAESVRLHLGKSHKDAMIHAQRMLELVEIPAAARRLYEYPHQLSGGMRQRVMIAMALACNPALLIADEPTTALDVTIQAQILDLLREAAGETGMAIMFITHNLGVVAEMADRVAVMYAGRMVEQGSVPQIVRPAATSLHDRPAGLRARSQQEPCDRRRGPATGRDPGSGARALAPPPGCAFKPRCPIAIRRCRRPCRR